MKRLRWRPEPSRSNGKSDAYLRALETLEKVDFRFVPRPCTTAMIETEMPAAMRPYSMAVAPDWSFTKRETRVFMGWLLRSTRGCLSSTQRPFLDHLDHRARYQQTISMPLSRPRKTAAFR